MQAVMIAGTGSGSGKTTITAALIRLLKRKKFRVQAFKSGPDYIDPMFHVFSGAENSYNLDSVLLGEENMREQFEKHSQNADFCVVEGVMGFYDGKGTGTDGSAYSIAKMLNLPVLLVIDGRGVSQSAAAVVSGFMQYRPDCHIAGILINRIRSESHYKLLKTIIEENCQLPCVGWMQNNEELHLESRHLGLIPAEEVDALDETISRASDLLEAHLDFEKLLAISSRDCKEISPDSNEKPYASLRIGIARDKAFNFYYQDNLDRLENLGITLVQFSPMEDKILPEVDALYFGGGFPEIFVKQLDENIHLRNQILQALEQGMPCYAECGGMMYLCERIITLDGIVHQGIGFLSGEVVMTPKLNRFGYAEMNMNLFGKTYSIMIHEFHHSKLEKANEPYISQMKKGTAEWQEMRLKKNTLAGYPHLHFGSEEGQCLLSDLLDYVLRRKNENMLR